jgi:hypothetical protein
MRKLSLFIIAASATLGVSVAQAEDAPQAVEGPDAVTVEPEVIVDPVPEDVATGELVDPPFVVEELILHPVDEVVELTDEQVVEDTAVEDTAVEDGAVDDTAVDPVEGEVATDEGGDDAGVVEDTGSTDENPEKVDDTLIYMTTGGVDPRPEGCMECRNLTGVANDTATEAPAPEVMADVLDGNATGVDVMDPAEAKKRK